jgi:predicted Zn-dependent protease
MRISFILKNRSDKGGEIPFGKAWQCSLHIEDEEKISPALKGLRKRVSQDQLELAKLYIGKARVADIVPDTPPSAAVDTGLQSARALIARKDGTSAVPVPDRYVRSYPQSAEGFNLLGYSLRNQNKFDQALAAYPPRGAA